MNDILNAGVSDAASGEGVSDDAAIEKNADKGLKEDQAGESEKTGDPRVDDPWPKSARNAMSRRDKQLGQYKARLSEQDRRMADMQRQIDEFTQKSRPENKEPVEDDFDNYGDYLKAVAKYRPTQSINGREQSEKSDQPLTREQAIEQARVEVHYQNRQANLERQAETAMREIPGYAELVDEYSDVIESARPEIVAAFLDADNGHLAFYALAKEGKLEQLAHMTPSQAAIAIARAEVRGEQMAKAAKVSKAPPPISGAKGSAAGQKGLADMRTVDDVMKWVNS